RLGRHGTYKLAFGAFFRPREMQVSGLQYRTPEAGMQLGNPGFVRVVETVKHEPKRQLAVVIEFARAAAIFAGLDIGLAFAGSQKNILPAAALEHALRQRVVFAVYAVGHQFWTMHVPFEMRPYLILDIG